MRNKRAKSNQNPTKLTVSFCWGRTFYIMRYENMRKEQEENVFHQNSSNYLVRPNIKTRISTDNNPTCTLIFIIKRKTKFGHKHDNWIWIRKEDDKRYEYSTLPIKCWTPPPVSAPWPSHPIPLRIHPIWKYFVLELLRFTYHLPCVETDLVTFTETDFGRGLRFDHPCCVILRCWKRGK